MMRTESAVQVVWFKRDLRVRDHVPLRNAAAAGQVVALYVYEPALIESPDFDGAHLRHINAALTELQSALNARSGRLVTRVGEITAVLEQLRNECAIAALWSHEETTQQVAYARDRDVRRWCRSHNIPWHEPSQTGVVRRLKSRDGWAKAWTHTMASPPVAAPTTIMPAQVSGLGILDADALQALGVKVPSDSHELFVAGGERFARRTLASFLTDRGVDYRRAMSSPVTAFDACSRISEHLALGTLSIRQALHASAGRRAELQAQRADGMAVDPRWLQSLSSFESRLHWHCHFMQKLEDEPAIENRCVCRPYESLRDANANEQRLEAWKSGHTGVPMVDACMRALRAHGWINFRMRAMLVSYAAYDLWLDWRTFSKWLARQFVDYEPGIHYSQLQMQSGTTGINTLRIYNPYTQGETLDPEGSFTRAWVPELAALPAEWIHRPHEMPPLVQGMYGVTIGRDYPAPLVDHAQAVRDAKARFTAARAHPGFRAAARAVYERHGSRAQSARARGL